MSIITRNGISYDIKINKMRIQPLFMVNDSVMDVGLWDNTQSDKQEILLLEAIACYEYNRKNKTLIKSNTHIHKH